MKIVRIWEGLGNQMFQYAFAKSLEQKSRQKIYIDRGDSFKESFEKFESNIKRPYTLDKFNISLPMIEDIEKVKEWGFLHQKSIWDHCKFYLSQKGYYHHRFIFDSYDVTQFNEKYFSVSESAYYMGWFQNENYFKDIREILLKEFRTLEPIQYKKELPDDRATVSIHVRRGDFVVGNWCVSPDYYNKAMEYINSKVENPLYIVFTDDLEWAKKNWDNNKNIHFSDEYGNFRDYEELCVMSKCNHNIIANSTFSWWGAWLNENNNIVITPRVWTPRQQNINPNNWIKI